jgi:TPP-dependent pyruvate/acetoin dehydrogenase alpha subunit
LRPETITAWSAAVQALAAIVSLIVAGVLAFVTYRYVKLTKGILDETSKAREANEDSARAALDSVKLMRQQLEEQAGLGHFIVKSTIDRAVAAIEAILQPEPLRNFNVLSTCCERGSPTSQN